MLDLFITNYSHIAAVTSFRYDEASNRVILSAVSASPDDAADFVDILEKNEMVQPPIRFRGYGFDNEGRYTITIEVALAVREREAE
jgi:hypothetical protein